MAHKDISFKEAFHILDGGGGSALGGWDLDESSHPPSGGIPFPTLGEFFPTKLNHYSKSLHTLDITTPPKNTTEFTSAKKSHKNNRSDLQKAESNKTIIFNRTTPIPSPSKREESQNYTPKNSDTIQMTQNPNQKYTNTISTIIQNSNFLRLPLISSLTLEKN